MRWQLDHKAAEAFARELGITGPITFKRTGRRRRTWAVHYFRRNRIDGSYQHTVAFDGQRSALAAAGSIAHELCHAKQAEDAERGPGWRAIVTEQRRIPYAERPMEVEAEQWSVLHGADFYKRAIRIL